MLFSHYLFVHQNAIEGRSFAFASFAINSMIYIFAYRSLRRSIFKSLPLSENKPLIWAVVSGLAVALLAFAVPGLRRILGIVPLTMVQWAAVFAVAIGLLVVVELGKAVSNAVHRVALQRKAVPARR